MFRVPFNPKALPEAAARPGVRQHADTLNKQSSVFRICG